MFKLKFYIWKNSKFLKMLESVWNLKKWNLRKISAKKKKKVYSLVLFVTEIAFSNETVIPNSSQLSE
jgi:hypothetical protein